MTDLVNRLRDLGDRAPERIWIDAERTYSATSFSAGIKYIRADLHDAEVQRLTRERDAANSRAKGNWKHLSRLWDLAKGYDPDDDEEGPRCRDCADENGRCPHSGFPCDPQEEAEERIRKMFAASSTEPAAPSVSAAAKVLLESKTVSVLIAAGKKIDAEELLSALANKENSDE